MTVKMIPGTGYASNTYILISGGDAAVVDPSASVAGIQAALEGARLRMILLTHGHFDHLLWLDLLKCELGGEVYIHTADAEMPGDPELNASVVFGYKFAALPVSYLLTGGETLTLGRENIEVLHTPGHTPGSVCYLCGNHLICGDTLFASGYGRYDLPGGNRRLLFASLRTLADIRNDPMIYPGHGNPCLLSSSLIIRELRSSQF